MDIQLKKGFIEAVVLALLRHSPTYGYRLYIDVNKVIPISESTLYPILRRLETQDFLYTFQEEWDNRLRKYYVITPTGIARYDEYVRMCHETAKVIDFIIEGGK